MKEGRLRKIEKASKQRDMLIQIRSSFKYDEKYYKRLEFYDRNCLDYIDIKTKVLCVFDDILQEVEKDLRELLNIRE